MDWRMVRDFNEVNSAKEGVTGTWREAATKEETIRALTRMLYEEAGAYMEGHDPARLLDVRDVLDELWSLVASPAAASGHVEKVRAQGMFRNHVLWHPVPGTHA